jgi:putative PIN family toxin of toxin-antitoxin system
MITVFIDTSVIFSACYSKLGASALLLGYCRKKKIKGYISKYVLSELKRNAALKLDQAGKQRLNFYLLQAHLSIVDNPTDKEIAHYKKIIESQDAPILAAAVKSTSHYLVTLDIKDFQNPQVKQLVKPLIILSPKDFLSFIK